MSFQFKNKKNITSPNIAGDVGSFSLETPICFEKCRERFASQFTDLTTGFYFLHNPNQSIHVANFINRTEEILQVNYSKFSETNRNHILWFEPSLFWLKCEMKRSLLTILLRCGMFYRSNPDEFEAALFSESQILRTKDAVFRFLFGFTKYVGPSLNSNNSKIIYDGWVNVYEYKSISFIRNTLVSDKRILLDLGEVLWC